MLFGFDSFRTSNDSEENKHGTMISEYRHHITKSVYHINLSSGLELMS